jgi:hypothetical protein
MAVSINFYDHFLERLGDGGFDMDNDTFNIALMNSSHTFTAANTLWSQVSANEIANGNGYTTGGQALSSVTWGQTGGTVTFDAADVSWTASGGDIGPTTDAVIRETSGGLLVCSIDFDASLTAADTADLLITLNASGIFNIS